MKIIGTPTDPTQKLVSGAIRYAGSQELEVKAKENVLEVSGRPIKMRRFLLNCREADLFNWQTTDGRSWSRIGLADGLRERTFFVLLQGTQTIKELNTLSREYHVPVYREDEDFLFGLQGLTMNLIELLNHEFFDVPCIVLPKNWRPLPGFTINHLLVQGPGTVGVRFHRPQFELLHCECNPDSGCEGCQYDSC